MKLIKLTATNDKNFFLNSDKIQTILYADDGKGIDYKSVIVVDFVDSNNGSNKIIVAKETPEEILGLLL